MNSYLQLLSFFVSFGYGMLFYLLTRFNKFILSNKKYFLQFIITLVFIIDIVIIYIYIMYKINNGIIHPYFVITLIIGYILMLKLFDKCKILCKICVKKIKSLK